MSSNEKEILIKEINALVEEQHKPLVWMGFVSLCLKNEWPMPEHWHIADLKKLKEKLEEQNVKVKNI